MKRVLSFDFIRGIAIIGVLLFHVLNVAFADRIEALKDSVLGGGAPLQWYEAAWYVLGPALLILGSFNGLFVMVSAASNAISVQKQWDRLVLDQGTSKSAAFKRIMTAQATRGGLIWAFGFLSEGVFGQLLVSFLGYLNGQPVSNLAITIPRTLLLTNILTTIGLSIIFSSLIQLAYLKNGLSLKKTSILLVMLVIGCTALIPVTRAIAIGAFGTDTFTAGAESIEFPEAVARFVLAPFIGRWSPLIPFFSCAAFGLLVSINISARTINPALLRKCLYGGLLLVASSFIVGLVTGIDIGNRERSLFYQLFVLGLEIMTMSFMIYMIDFRKKTRIDLFLKWTGGIRRFGILTLSLWMLQYMMIFPVLLIQAITAWPLVQGGANDPQIAVVMLLMLGLWHLVLKLWARVNFKGSVEWIMTYVLSGRGSSGDRAVMTSIIKDSESMIAHVPGAAIDAKEKAMAIACIAFACLYGLVIALVLAGAISL